jgi:hypothetical protein
MKRRNFKVRFWLVLAVACITLLPPAAAQATTNVVPNPGFEQGGCVYMPIICGWHAYDGFIARDTANPQSGSASMSLQCGPFPCFPDPDGNPLLAATDFTSCPPIGPGTHPASFWYRAGPEVLWVALEAVFYQGPGCTGLPSADSINGSAIGDDAWHELAGGLVAPPGTESVWFLVGAAMVCDYSGCLTGANFDDLDFESEALPSPPETTITAGPTGTINSNSATFEFTANEPSTFECSLDTGAFAACASPKTYTGLADGSHTLRVRATDEVGTTDPTPAERTWTVRTNLPPSAHFTFSCTAQTCTFDGGGSSDPDGSIAAYAWDFGDGTSGSGTTIAHTYEQAADHTVTLTATDHDGATATDSKAVLTLHLTARGYKARALQKVDLSWNGPSGTSFDVYRGGVTIATLQATAYTDNINKKGSASYMYKVCAAAGSSCSNQATVRF